MHRGASLWLPTYPALGSRRPTTQETQERQERKCAPRSGSTGGDPDLDATLALTPARSLRGRVVARHPSLRILAGNPLGTTSPSRLLFGYLLAGCIAVCRECCRNRSV